MNKVFIPKVGEVKVKDLSMFFQDLDSIVTLWHCDLNEEDYAKLVTHTATTIRAFLRDKIHYTEELSCMRAVRHIADPDGQEQFDRNMWSHKKKWYHVCLSHLLPHQLYRYIFPYIPD